jgi:hypothetical protein
MAGDTATGKLKMPDKDMARELLETLRAENPKADAAEIASLYSASARRRRSGRSADRLKRKLKILTM